MRRFLSVLVPLLLPVVFVAGYVAGGAAGDERAGPTVETRAALSAQVPAPEATPAPVAGDSPRATAQGVEEGAALATMRIPRFGADWEWTTLEGIGPDTLARGPGHFPETPLPGEEGNSAFAAHRAGYGDPFIDFDRLQVGDRIIVEQRDATWTYRVTAEPRLIDPEDVWVLDPLPGRMLTLTTCWPKYGNERRLYVRAELV